MVLGEKKNNNLLILNKLGFGHGKSCLIVMLFLFLSPIKLVLEAFWIVLGF